MAGAGRGRARAWPTPAEGGRGGGRGARPRRPWWRRARVVVPLAVVVLLVLGQGGRQTPGPAAVPPTVPAAPAATPEPGVGAPVRDGTLEFTVTGFACGQERIGVPPFDRAAQGVYCLVDVEVANVGDAARRVPANQLLFDAEDREYELDGAVPWLLRDGGLWDPVNPGNRVRGTLAFDVPPGLVPVRVELHGGWFTGGAAVRLDAPG